MARQVEIEITEEALERARSGDVGAQADIYAAVAPATFGLIRRLVGNRALAEDLFPDTMMTLYGGRRAPSSGYMKWKGIPTTRLPARSGAPSAFRSRSLRERT